MKRLLDLLFACRHPNLSRVFHKYQVCLTCGKHVEPKVRLGK